MITATQDATASVAAFDPDRVSFTSGCFISDRIVPCEGGEYALRRPSDGKEMRPERSASRGQVDEAAASAERAFRTSGWPTMAPRDRARILRRWADLIDDHAEELAQLEAFVSTRVIAEVRARDIPITAEIIRYFAEHADKIDGQVLASASNALSLVVREPHGVVAGIAPWNMPLVLAAHKFAPALAAGNAVLLKPSELTPYAILRVAELSAQAGLPHGIFAVLPGVGSETGAALVEHPLVSYLSFTGSTATGRAVMASAALSGPKPVSLELGGKTPQLVFADAPNLEGVAQTVASSITRNGGQICFAGTRLIVEESIADAFVEHVASLMSAVTAGPTWDPRTTLAPIISQKQADRVVEIVRAAKSDGAELVIGGEMFYANGGGIYFEPTILRNVAEGSTVLCDEVFGPVLTVQTFSDVDEGIRLADHPVYGLAAAVYTGNLDVALHAMRTIAAGTFWVNHFGPTDLASPIGGYKQSGFGKDYGAAAFDKYLKSKTVYVDMQQHIRKGSP